MLASRRALGGACDLAARQCICFEKFAAANTWQFNVEEVDIGVPIHARLMVSTAAAAHRTRKKRYATRVDQTGYANTFSR
jgi:hypothetical protein